MTTLHESDFTHVIKQVVIVWNTKAIQENIAETTPPNLVHSARNPMKRARTAKNKPMRMNGNIKRDVKK